MFFLKFIFFRYSSSYIILKEIFDYYWDPLFKNILKRCLKCHFNYKNIFFKNIRYRLKGYTIHNTHNIKIQ